MAEKTIDFQSTTNNLCFVYLIKREKYSMVNVCYWPESGDWLILLWFLDINYKNSSFNFCQQIVLLMKFTETQQK